MALHGRSSCSPASSTRVRTSVCACSENSASTSTNYDAPPRRTRPARSRTLLTSRHNPRHPRWTSRTCGEPSARPRDWRSRQHSRNRLHSATGSSVVSTFCLDSWTSLRAGPVGSFTSLASMRRSLVGWCPPRSWASRTPERERRRSTRTSSTQFSAGWRSWRTVSAD